MADSPDPEYVEARSALLDALDALGPHRQAVILVGAQAIYVHTGEGEFAVSPFTYDADLAVDPRKLGDEPNIVDAMKGAGFRQTDQPGIYKKAHGRQQVDLLVPEALGGAGQRGARLGRHGNRAAMKVSGIEGALVDHSPRSITALDEADLRSYVIEVAGPAALPVSKIQKVAERAQGIERRQDHKDAFDIYRILRATDTADLAASLKRLLAEEVSIAVTAEALSRLEEHFGKATAVGTRLVLQHIEGIEDMDFISASCVALSQDLLAAIGEVSPRPPSGAGRRESNFS